MAIRTPDELRKMREARGDEPVVNHGEKEYIESLQPGAREEAEIQTRPRVDQTVVRGHCRLLPPGKNSINDLTPEWIMENWYSPSPWCRIEGMADHPEFEKNLKSAGVV